MTHKQFYLHLSALRVFAFKHPIYAFKLFRSTKMSLEDRCYFHVKATSKLVQRSLQNPNLSSIESIMKNRTLSFFHFACLYAICRVLKPSLVVETGVGAGLSSTFILQALHDNNHGSLYSIDFPRAVYQSATKVISNDSFWIPRGKDSGWVIPDNLRKRWVFIKGKSIDALPKLLIDLKNVDLFFHDSEHTYKNMMREYQVVWPHIKSKGILASHDVDWNSAFVDFGKQINRTPIISVTNEFGVITRMKRNK